MFTRPSSLIVVLCFQLLVAGCSSKSGDESDGGRTAEDTRGGEGSGDAADAADVAPGDVAGDLPIQIDLPTVDLPFNQDASADARVQDECAQMTAVGDPVYAPIDIIWAIDTSPSMDEETRIVTEQLNEFVEYIGTTGLDVRVIMVGDSTICVPAPLSGGGCPDINSEIYRHVRTTVDSTNAFQALISSWDSYSDFLRRDAIKHFVVVSDDESARQVPWFEGELATRGLRYFVFHSIVSLEENTAACIAGICPGCQGPYGGADSMGRIYMLLSDRTGGTKSSICEPDWSVTFEGISENVISGAVLPCQYAIPDLGSGLEIAFDQVDVTINGVVLSRHLDAAGCNTAPGWYYDSNTAPTQVNICPNVCGAGFQGDEIVIEFGCVKG